MASYDLPFVVNFSDYGFVVSVHGNETSLLGNYSFMGDEGNFFMTYYSPYRFWTECSLAVLSGVFNFLALAAVLCAGEGHGHRPRRRTIYHTLFVNLALANILTCILSLICNNILFLFEDQIYSMIFKGYNICLLMVYMMAAGVFVSSAFGIESFLTMLGFATIQYFAICSPLENLTFATKKRVVLFLLLSWSVSLAIACTPFVITLVISNGRDCSSKLQDLIFLIVLTGVNSCVSLVAIVYVVIIFLCVRIYYEVRQMEQRISQFRADNDLKYERKAFFTTVIILSALTIFYLPYSIIHIVSLNSSTGKENIENGAIIYYMTLLPYLKCLSDPLIYGLKMREFHHMGRNLAFCCYRLRRRWSESGDNADDSPQSLRAQRLPLTAISRLSVSKVTCNSRIDMC